MHGSHHITFLLPCVCRVPVWLIKPPRKARRAGTVVREGERLWGAGRGLFLDSGGDFTSICFIIDHWAVHIFVSCTVFCECFTSREGF